MSVMIVVTMMAAGGDVRGVDDNNNHKTLNPRHKPGT